MSIDTLGNTRGPLRVMLRPDQPAGISYGGRDYAPGETATLPFGIAAQLVATGRARVVAEESAAAADPVADPVRTPDPPLVTRDPAPRRRR